MNNMSYNSIPKRTQYDINMMDKYNRENFNELYDLNDGVGSTIRTRSSYDVKLQSKWCPSCDNQQKPYESFVINSMSMPSNLYGVGSSWSSSLPIRNRSTFDQTLQTKSVDNNWCPKNCTSLENYNHQLNNGKCSNKDPNGNCNFYVWSGPRTQYDIELQKKFCGNC
jgi:hypothetical protein